MPPKLSVVLGTLNRLQMLERQLASIRQSCGSVAHEIIVVDGGSTDGTADWLAEQEDVRVVWQGERLGAVAAFNAGFAVAAGEYVANSNDDSAYNGDTLKRAVEFLDNRPGCGQVAIPFSDPRHLPAVDYIKVGRHRRAYLYANFGVTRRALGAALGWWGTVCHHYGGDTELSLKIWQSGYSVDVLPYGSVEHFRAQDETRIEQDRHSQFAARWDNWSGEIIYADASMSRS